MIRAATPADAAAVAAIWNRIIRETLHTFNAQPRGDDEVAGLIAATAAAGRGFFVAESGGAVAGYAFYQQFRSGVGYARTMEHSIALDPGARGRGLGRGLMRALEDHARAAGVHSMFAGVSGANRAGRAFHAALGYRDVATLCEVGHKWDQWLDLHLMQKFLSPQRGKS